MNKNKVDSREKFLKKKIIFKRWVLIYIKKLFKWIIKVNYLTQDDESLENYFFGSKVFVCVEIKLCLSAYKIVKKKKIIVSFEELYFSMKNFM